MIPTDALLPNKFHRRLAKLDWRDQSFADSTATINACLPGILLAGAAYPTVVACYLYAVRAFLEAITLGNLSHMIELLTGCVLFGAIGGFFSGLAGAVLGWTIVPYLNGLLGYKLNARHLVAVTGGSCGAVCAYLWLPFEMPNDHVPYMFFFVGVATFMGQSGAIWYASKPQSWIGTTHSDQFGERGDTQFQLSQLFVLTAIVAMVLGIDRVTKFSLGYPVFTYIVLQSITLSIDTVWREARRHLSCRTIK